MKVLITEIKKLLDEHELKGFRVAILPVGINKFYINYKEDPEGIQPEGILEVGFRNTSRNAFKHAENLPDTYVFFPGMREDILKAIVKAIEIYKTSTPIDDLENYFEDLYNNQEAVMETYRSRMGLIEKDVQALHMFFSPGRVVAGLTDTEVRLCIMLLPQREKQKENCDPFYPPHLYPELIQEPDTEMPRTEGLQKAVFELLMELANQQPIINL